MFKRIFCFVISTHLAGCAIQPNALKESQKKDIVEKDIAAVNAISSLPDGAVLSFPDIVARGIFFNRDRTIASLETQLAQMQSDTSVFEQLPTLVQRLNRDTRNNLQASSSVGITDGEVDAIDPDANYVVSSDKSSYKRDLKLAFNLLDYGLAVTKSEQIGNNLLITREKERQALQAIFEQAQNLYWRAVTSDYLLQFLPELIKETDEALLANTKIQQERLQDPIQALTFKRELLDVKRTLLDLQLDLLSAKTDLAVYIGLRPDHEFTLKETVQNRFPLPDLQLSLDDMETLALLNRSDYEQVIYETNNIYLQSRANFMQALPQITLSTSVIYDNSPYVLNQGWRNVGAEFSWNVLNLFRLGSIEDSNKIQEQLIDEKRVQMALQILGLTKNAKMSLNQNIKRFDLSSEYLFVSLDLLSQLESITRVNRNGQLTLIKERLNSLLSKHRKNLAYADVLSAFATNVSAIGVDIVPSDWRRYSASGLSDAICERYEYWFNYSAQSKAQLCGEIVDAPLASVTVVEETPEIAAEIEPAAPVEQVFALDLFYATNAYELTAQQKNQLLDFIKQAKESDIRSIAITGYADITGNNAWNEELAFLRSRKVGRFLRQHMEPSVPIVEEPVGGTETFSSVDLTQNRRVQVSITAYEKSPN